MASSQILAPAETAERMPVARFLGAMRRWFPRVLLSIADQGFASGAHFAMSLLLARWLSPAEFGAFAVAFAVLLFAAGLHNALILEPMTVIGPAHYGGQLPSYLWLIVCLHGGLTMLLAAILLPVALIMAACGSAMAPVMFALSISVPAILFFWLFRRACYLSAKPDLALKGSLLYALVLVAGLVTLRRKGLVSAPGALLLMGVVGMATSLPLWPCLGVRPGRGVSLRPAGSAVAEVVRRHWGYARWSLGSTVLYWLASSIYLPALAALAGLQAVAAFRATDNLLVPMSQVLTALGLLLLPWVTAQSRVRGCGYLKATALKIGLVTSLATGAYAVGLAVAGPALIRWIYGGGYYAAFLPLIPYLGVALALRAVGDTGFGMAARAAGRPDMAFWGTLTAAVVTLTTGLGLVARYGAAGAAAGWMASSAASCIVSVCLVRWQLR